MRTENPPPVRLSDYRAPDWLVETVHVDIKLHPHETRVRATLQMKPNSGQGTPASIVLDGDGLTLISLKINGAALSAESFAANPDRLVISQPPHGPLKVEIETVLDPSANTQLMGLYRSNDTYCTQCEAEGFRRITYFPDRPDVMAVYTTRVEAEMREAPVLLSNGNLVESGDIAGTNRHYAVFHDPFPKPSYLFALVAGDLACVEDTFTTMSGRKVALKIFVEHGRQDQADYAMDSLKRSMRWDEDAFGREYDLDIFMIVAVSAFNMGAMENKGLNVFNDKYVLAAPQTATDNDYASIEAIIAHEYFHNWTGNRITCRDWFQLCLKEGLTVFRDQEFTSDQRSRPVKRIADVRGLRSSQFSEDAGPLAHPVRPEIYHEINNFYTATVYQKGAEIIRMLKVLIGDEAFRQGMDLYFDRHDGEAVTIEQFLECFAQVSGRDLNQFKLWYSQAGTPEVAVTEYYDERSKTYRLELAQTTPPTPGQPSKEPMVIPIALGFLAEDGHDLPINREGTPDQRGIVVLSKAAETFTFTGLNERPVPSLNRGFSAPIKLIENSPDKALRLRAAHDSDPFNRWQAIQTIATRVLIKNSELLRDGKAFSADDSLTHALSESLRDTVLDPAFVAQILTLPTESDLAREIGRDVDPDAIFSARSALRRAIGLTLTASLKQTYAKLASRGPYSPDAVSAGRRLLKNVCLDLLTATGDVAAIAIAVQQYDLADNMTDRSAALSSLTLHDCEERRRALTDFYQRFESDPLVIDKWFVMQATIPESGTLDRVRALTEHPAFSISNPNRVRSLIGAFAHGNQTQFNRRDGAGYRFVADIVLALNATNPQVAARLLTSFKSWRSIETGRRAHAEAALRKIAVAPGLSPDVADIAQRSLAA